MRVEHLEGGYSVCFESHTADADLAGLFRGLPDDRCQLPRWGYVLRGQGRLPVRRPRGDLRRRRRLLRAAGPHAGPLRGRGDRRVQPHGRAGRDDRRRLENLRSAPAESRALSTVARLDAASLRTVTTLALPSGFATVVAASPRFVTQGAVELPATRPRRVPPDSPTATPLELAVHVTRRGMRIERSERPRRGPPGTRSRPAMTGPTRRRRCGWATRACAAPGSARACASSTWPPAAAPSSIPAARLGARVLATDLSPAMLERLERRARDEGLSIETRVMDGHALELDDDSFDIAGSQFGVMLFPDMPKGIARAGARHQARRPRADERVRRPARDRVPRLLRGARSRPSSRRSTARRWIRSRCRSSSQDPERLRQELAAAGLRDVEVETDHRDAPSSGPASTSGTGWCTATRSWTRSSASWD